MKRFITLFITIIMGVAMIAANYRIDSVYQSYSFTEKSYPFTEKQIIAKTIYQYNEKNQKIHAYSFHKEDGIWRGKADSTYEYSSNGLLEKETVHYKRNNIDMFTQKIYTYKDTLVSAVESRYKRDTTQWQTTSYIEYGYNQKNLLVRESLSYDDKSTEDRRYEYLYDFNNNKVQTLIYENRDKGFVVIARYQYLYNDDNLLIQEKHFVHDELLDKKKYEYDEQHFKIKMIEYHKDLGVLLPIYMHEYTNDANGREILCVSYTNEEYDGNFVVHTKVESAYDSKGNLTGKTYMTHFQGTWYRTPDKDERWIYFYNN